MTGSEPVLFYGEEDILSNFYPSPLNIGGRIFATVEHYYQAQKFIHAPEIYEQIVRAPTPDEAKKISRAHPDRIRPDWQQLKEAVMWAALQAKFTQHENLCAALLSTGNRALIENSPTDRYWGKIPHGDGLNRLGELLMKLREELRTPA